MSNITTRSGKGSALTHTELDTNFSNLNTDKLENITGESIGDLSDVDLTNNTDGYVLTYNSTSGNIELAAAAGGGSTALDDLTDVVLTVAPSVRYWRIYMTDVLNNTYAGIHELEFYDGATNITTGGTGIANQATFPVSRAFDGDLTNMWLGELSNGEAWIGYDFGVGNTASVSKVVLKSGNNNEDTLPNGFKVEYSSDNVTWTAVKTVTGEPNWSTYQTREYTDFTFSTTGANVNDYIIYNGTNWTNKPALSIAGDDLSDVAISSPSEGEILVYNSTLSQWQNQTHSFNGISEVNVVLPDTNDVLTYDGSEWVAGPVSISNSTLTQLNDVTTSSAPPAARYWRIYATEVQNSVYMGAHEIEFKSSIGGSDATGSGTAISSNGSPASAFDDNMSTRPLIELDANGEAWIGYDFGSGNDIQILEVTIKCGDSVEDIIPKNYRVEYSDDASSWTSVYEVTNGTNWAQLETRTVNGFTSPGSNTNDILKYNGSAWVNVSSNQTHINTQTGTAYTTQSSDMGGHIRMNNASANTLTVSGGQIGDTITVEQTGAGATSIQGDTGITINAVGTLTVSGQYGVITLIKVDSSTWTAYGNLT